MNDRFIPGRVDYAGRIARGFNTGRAVQPHAQEVWHSALKPYFGSASRILDVGAGTGRFAVLLAQWFGASIIGVEPAEEMRRIAVTDGRHANASYVGGPAEQLSFKANAFDAALLSHVYHHVVDRAACDNELFRVLRPDGCVVLRGAFAGRLGEITLFDYFPEAKLICE